MNSRRLTDGPRAEDTTSNRAKTNTVEGVGREDSYVRLGQKQTCAVREPMSAKGQ
jgi:hypothetical protein